MRSKMPAIVRLMSLSLTLVLLAGCGAKQTSTPTPGATSSSPKQLKEIVIAEPVHNLGYLPLYVAVRKGYFEEAGLKASVLLSTGGAHVTTVISNDAWGFIGGPDSAAFANQKGQSIKSIVNVVNRANVYLMAKKGVTTPSSPEAMKSFLDGKTAVGGRYGGTPNLLMRYLIKTAGLEPMKQVKLVELADGGTILPQMERGGGDIAYTAEPDITAGVERGVWQEPFYSFPASLGDYAYSTINVKAQTYEKDPETAQAFVNALLKGLKLVLMDKAEAFKISEQEFPNMKPEAIKASLDRAYADNLWSPDGTVSQKALTNAMDVPTVSGLYTGTYSYDALVDMRFVKKALGQ